MEVTGTYGALGSLHILDLDRRIKHIFSSREHIPLVQSSRSKGERNLEEGRRQEYFTWAVKSFETDTYMTEGHIYSRISIKQALVQTTEQYRDT